MYKIKAWKIPEGTSSSKGKSLFNILPLKNHQSISSIMPFPEEKTELKDMHIVFATSKGKIRKNSLEDFSSINASGKIAMKLDSNDKIVGVKICKDDQDVILSTKFGKCIRFEAKKLRVFKGRSSKGIKGIELAANDQIVSLNQIESDLKSDRKMFRLLQGDVGSGKTVVALSSCLNVIKSEYQVAFMAPTEILARQHYELAKKVFNRENPECIIIGMTASFGNHLFFLYPILLVEFTTKDIVPIETVIAADFITVGLSVCALDSVSYTHLTLPTKA